jgi:LytS/YehU family sensor histidine kinase
MLNAKPVVMIIIASGAVIAALTMILAGVFIYAPGLITAGSTIISSAFTTLVAYLFGEKTIEENRILKAQNTKLLNQMNK